MVAGLVMKMKMVVAEIRIYLRQGGKRLENRQDPRVNLCSMLKKEKKKSDFISKAKGRISRRGMT